MVDMWVDGCRTSRRTGLGILIAKSQNMLKTNKEVKITVCSYVLSVTDHSAQIYGKMFNVRNCRSFSWGVIGKSLVFAIVSRWWKPIILLSLQISRKKGNPFCILGVVAELRFSVFPCLTAKLQRQRKAINWNPDCQSLTSHHTEHFKRSSFWSLQFWLSSTSNSVSRPQRVFARKHVMPPPPNKTSLNPAILC